MIQFSGFFISFYLKFDLNSQLDSFYLQKKKKD